MDVTKAQEKQTHILSELLQEQRELKDSFRLMLDKMEKLSVTPTALTPTAPLGPVGASSTMALAQILAGILFYVCSTYPFNMYVGM